MSNLSQIIRKARFVSYHTFTGRRAVLRGARNFDRLHFASRNMLDVYSRRRLAALLTHAASTVPYYQEVLGSRLFTPNTVVESLAEGPILTKAIIRKQGEQLISAKPGSQAMWNTSGGSTGEPVRLRQDRRMAIGHRSVELMYMKWAGHEMGEPHVLVWGVPHETVGTGITLHERLFRFACNQTYLNCYRITDEVLDGWISAINQKHPTLIEAYVDALFELAKRVLQTRTKVASPRGIIASAGVLTAEARKVIGEAFKCPTFNRYGSREVANVACSCHANQELHVNEPWCYMEIVDDAGNPCAEGEEGNILITLYDNFTMPLIRYRIEDRGVWGGSDVCLCGRTTRRLAAVCGRTSDYLIAADGTKINGTALTTLLYSVTGIQRFQYRQSADGKVVLAAIPLSNGVTNLKHALEKPASQLRNLLKGRDVEVAIVKEIPPSNSGKYRYIINEMAPPPNAPGNSQVLTN